MKRIVTEVDQASWDVITFANPDSEWRVAHKTKIIEHIETGEHEYFVQTSDGSELLVQVVSDGNSKYLSTSRQIDPDDAIFSLPTRTKLGG